jgi:hypothetical protein
VQLGVRFHYLTQPVTEEILQAIANGPRLFGEKEKHLRRDVIGEERDIVHCMIETIHNENGKKQAEHVISGFAVCHAVDGNKKLVGRKHAFTRALHELTRLSVPLCALNGGAKVVRTKFWEAYLDQIRVEGYRKPVVEEKEAVPTGA